MTTPPYGSMLTGEWAYAYDAASPGVIKRAYVTHAYDAFGNETERVDYGNYDTTGDESTSAVTYVPNASALIVGLPSSPARHAGVGTGGTLLTSTQAAYDGAAVGSTPTARLITRQEEWHDTTSAYVTTQRSYDTWGNPTTVTDASNASTTTTYDPVYHLFPESITSPTSESTTAH